MLLDKYFEHEIKKTVRSAEKEMLQEERSDEDFFRKHPDKYNADWYEELFEEFGFFGDFEFNEKPEKVITEVNGIALPEDYLFFMEKRNGGQGYVGDSGLKIKLYRLEELKEINDKINIQKEYPGCVALGYWMPNENAILYYDSNTKSYGSIEYKKLLFWHSRAFFWPWSHTFIGFLIKMDQDNM